MDIKGRFKDLSIDFVSGKAVISFTTDANKETISDMFQMLKDKLLDISFAEHKQKRSLNANAYAWVLMEKIARAIREQNPDVLINTGDLYEQYIQRMCLFERDQNDELVWILINADQSIKLHDGHWRFNRNIYVKEGGGKEICVSMYLKLRGSSTFDSKEMYQLIQMIIDDAKQYGVETLTPSEIEKMANAWRPKK